MTTYHAGFYQDVFRVELLEKARSAHPQGLLVCEACGWSWLTIETAKIDPSLGSGFCVACANDADCFRRSSMNMKPGVS